MDFFLLIFIGRYLSKHEKNKLKNSRFICYLYLFYERNSTATCGHKTTSLWDEALFFPHKNI